ncbi:hypothetical protein KL918_003252 [Ogataea parapolymorpha]|uniref:Uncharacterized protein n=1 Tax=Ogataea parapolymorpha (strain ATCC 26012 / BCRC 20466 / JCM 22074 / NRRL Y-7560 / DL-1) TaxID=871575 RepID=W1QC03_OGAPD|nr:hypothetical protein HPODL_01947 [Ogataea parapolymorpha DL-1]ESW97868.1 hypothetical protein HPODL_01947 [Ogataea parapolymorpha DL-1]KAG7867057.1 hypothetical protein KL918_003252 [Ogataea parapolymorpha]KAG7872421.1 hypothetical protein KL916_003156 [Ogataea parapolymorpha]
MLRRFYQTLVPSFALQVRQPVPSLRTKFHHNMQFRRKAESRIKLLRQIIPSEYMLDDYLLYYCIYFREHARLKTRLQGVGGSDVRIDLENIQMLGRHILRKRTYMYLFKEALKAEQAGSTDDLFDFPRNLRRMSNVHNRREFIDQFLRAFETDFKLDRLSEDQEVVKLEQETRPTILLYVVGFIHCQYGEQMCAEFVDEFVIKGRLAKAYTHRGLLEIAKDNRPQFSY